MTDDPTLRDDGSPRFSSPGLDFRVETLQNRIDAAMETNRPINPQSRVKLNGKMYHIENLPTADMRAQFGYGHIPAFTRPVIERPDGAPWQYTPNMCLVADGPRGVWIDNEHLVCPGCGMDFT